MNPHVNVGTFETECALLYTVYIKIETKTDLKEY